MKLLCFFSLLCCKISSFFLRLLGRGGTNLPGRIALKIHPGLLSHLSKNVSVIIITGTNGKTTTARMVEQCLKDSGISYFSNKSGANLLTGIASVFAQHSSLGGRCLYDYALIECDEAAFRTVSQHLAVKYLVVSNIFRDQLDRYGEITHTLASIREGIRHMNEGALCLNCDCSLTVSLAADAPGEVIWFGINVPIYEESASELSDALYCIKCRTKYSYHHTTYAHLGSFFCPSCGYRRPDPQIAVSDILSLKDSGSEVQVDLFGEKHKAHIHLPGGYNIYNGLACLAVSRALGLNMTTALNSLNHFECGFGRAEEFLLGKSPARMLLVKNPAGFNQVVNLLTSNKEPVKLFILLNDRFADGTDISWIWDVDFEKLSTHAQRFSSLCVSGIRRHELALRLKYAGFSPESITVEEDYDQLIHIAGADSTPSVFVPTYTAMFDLRRTIGRHTSIRAFYE